jgi:hypothetical protein
VIGRRFLAYPDLPAALPGWGPVTIRLFLRGLRRMARRAAAAG